MQVYVYNKKLDVRVVNASLLEIKVNLKLLSYFTWNTS